MPSTSNILTAANELTVFNDDGEKLALSSIPYTWSASGGTLSVVDDVYRELNHYSFKVTPSGGALTPVVVSLSSVTVDGPTNKGSKLVFHCQAKSSQSLDMVAQLKQTDPLDVPPDARESTGQIDAFTVCRSNYYEYPDTDTDLDFDIELTFSGHNNEPFYLTQFFFVNDDHFYRNPFVRSARRFIPAIYWDKDSEQEPLRFPMFKLLDAMSWAAGDSSQLYSNFFDYELSELDPENAFDADMSWQESSLVSVDYHDANYRRWLFQFIGAPLKKNIASTATGSVGGFWYSTANDIEDYAMWQLTNKYYGYAAGSNEAMQQAASLVLSGTKYANISLIGEFQLKITTLASETPDDLDINDSSPTLLDVVMPAKPMGFTLIHEAVASITLTLGDASLGQLDDEPLG